MRWRKFRNTLFSLIALLVIVLASISALVETQVGSRWVVGQLASLAGVRLGEIHGNLRSGLDIASVEYQQGEVKIHAQQLSFRWRPVDLFYSALMIDSFQVAQLRIQLPPAAPSSAATEPFSQWPNLRLPLRIQLRGLALGDIQLQQGELQQAWQSVRGDLSLGTFNLRYNELRVQHRDYELRLNGRTALDYPYDTEAELHWQWQQPPSPDDRTGLLYRGLSRLQGSLQQLELHNQLESPITLNAHASGVLVNEQDQLIELPALKLMLDWPAQTLPEQWWLADSTPPVSRGQVTAEGNWQDYRASLTGALQLPDTPALELVSQLQGDLASVTLESLRIRELTERLLVDTAALSALPDPSSPVTTSPATGSTEAQPSLNRAAQLAVSGRVQWAPHLAWQLAVDASAFNLAGLVDNWPSSLNANFRTQGSLQEGQWQAALEALQLSGELRGVSLQGSGGVALEGTRLHSEGLALTLGANQLQLKGSLGEQLDLTWDIKAPLLQQLDDSVSGSFISQGELRGDAHQPRISLSASASQLQWGDYALESLELALAPLSPQAQPLALQGVADALVNPPGSAAVAPAASPLPRFQVQQLLTPELLQEPYRLSLVASRLHLGEQYFSSINLKGSGSVAEHQLQGMVRSPSIGRVELGLNGAYTPAEWQGQFSQLAIKLTRVPRWWLTSGQPIRVTAQGVVLGEQCLTTRTNLTAPVQRDSTIENEQLRPDWQPNQSPLPSSQYDWLAKQTALPASAIETFNLPRLCLRGDWSTRTGAALDAQLDAVPLRQFMSLFKTEVFFAGVMDGSFSLRSPDLSLSGTRANLGITTRNAELRYQYAGGVTDVYPWKDFALRAQLQNAQLSAVSGLEWVGFGRMDMDSQIHLQQQRIERARLQLDFHNIAPLETLLPFTNDVKGQLSADMTLNGAFNAPAVAGQLSLREGSANLTRLGVNLQAISLSLSAHRDGRVNLLSEMQSGDGRLRLVGDLIGFGTGAWRAQAVVNGNDFRIVSLPQLKANLSPNIRLNADASAMQLSGDALIPWARANIKSLPPSATQVSSDVIVINDTRAVKAPEEPYQVFSNLNLALGDDVSFKGFGLTSKLSGRLNLLKEANRPFFTNGYVSVSEGSYKAYGQTLTIERGRLAFQGPYDDPGLDIRATRQIRNAEDTKVGLNISGTLQRPKANVFAAASSPVSDSEAMMMLLTGKPLKDASRADASLLLSAMSGLGMDSGGSITASINRFFGVDQLEVKSDDGIDQSQLWIGKYLTPKLLVRYVVGIFDQAFSFGLEYQLTDSLRIEAESGTTKSVDLIYRLER